MRHSIACFLAAYLLRALASTAPERESPRDGESAANPEVVPSGDKADVRLEDGDRDFDWITSDIVRAMRSSNAFPKAELQSLKEKGVYLRPLDSRAAKVLRPDYNFRKQDRYVDRVLSLLVEVFGDQAGQQSKQEPSSIKVEARKFFHVLYTSAQTHELQVRDLVIVTFLALYNCKDLDALANPGPNEGRDVGGFTGLREEDFERLFGVRYFGTRPHFSHVTYTLLHNHDFYRNQYHVGIALQLYKKMLESARSDGEPNMSSVLNLYAPARYGDKLAAADNGIRGDDLIALSAENPSVATNLIRMAHFYNRMSHDLVDILSTDDE